MSFKGHFCYRYSEIHNCGISSGSVCRGPCGKLAFPSHLAELGNWFCFANTTVKGSFFVKAVSDSSALIKQRTGRGKASYTEWAHGFQCSFRCLTEPELRKEGSHWWNSREFIETWFALAEQLDCAWLNLGRILLWAVWGGGRAESEPGPQSREWEQEGEGDPVQLVVTSAFLVPAQHSEQLAPVLLSSALPLHSPEGLSQTPFRTLHEGGRISGCLEKESSNTASWREGLV